MHEFSYEAPSTIEQAVGLLAAERDGARALCGGTDLLIQMRMGVRTPSRLVDIKGIPDLRRISFDAKSGLKLGGAVPCIEIFENPMMRKHYPGLTEAAHLIGSTQIQSRASVGGNLCNGSPAADSVPALIALGAVAHVVGPKGDARRLPVENFVTAPGQTVLQPGELLVELRVPAPAPHSSGLLPAHDSAQRDGYRGSRSRLRADAGRAIDALPLESRWARSVRRRS